MNKRVLAIILGGGKGSRLYPLTDERSKPAVPIAGKYRLVDIPISNCLNAGINRIYVLTQFNSASLNRHIKNAFSFDNFTKGFVDILAAEQTMSNTGWYQGTADAVRQSMVHILSNDFDYILILSGDQLYHMDFNEFLKHHIKNEADLSIANLPVTAKDATGFGIMKTDKDENIISFIEKPNTDVLKDWKSPVSKESAKKGKEYLASMGIYLFNKDALINALAKDSTQTDFGGNIIPDLVAGNEKVVSFQYEGYWTDIGTISSFFEANLDLASSFPQFNLFDNHNFIYTRARMLPPTKIVGGSIEKTLVTEGCIINAMRLNNSLLGIRTRVGEGTIVESAYIMGSDYYETLEEIQAHENSGLPPLGIGKNCYIQNAIIDRNTRIGNNVRIAGGSHMEDSDNDVYCVRDGIIIVRKNAVIPNGTIIE